MDKTLFESLKQSLKEAAAIRQGNDILVAGMSSDTLVGGADSDVRMVIEAMCPIPADFFDRHC